MVCHESVICSSSPHLLSSCFLSSSCFVPFRFFNFLPYTFSSSLRFSTSFSSSSSSSSVAAGAHNLPGRAHPSPTGHLPTPCKFTFEGDPLEDEQSHTATQNHAETRRATRCHDED
ncbi:hypothetical protein E2C01_101935 [Portunus trituberculatus]|uniref:Uncharacterized protein n=1 Tax=Portunus trituberculatus TaxID=210409 RepID=A0A5B7KN27_PORTR|nr:hypothetical protein [Portunus trituberculatus]